MLPRAAAAAYAHGMEPTTGGDPLVTAPVTEVTLALPEWVREFVEWDRPYAGDDERMRLVVALSAENVRRRTGGPFAAAIFDPDGRVVGVGVNLVERLGSAVAHAEVMAIMLAQRRVGSYTLRTPALPPTQLFSSCAPCAMCLGAVLWSGVRRLVWGALRDDALAIGFEEGPVFPESIAYVQERGIEVVPGVLRAQARAVLEEYARTGGRIYNG